MKKLFRTIFLTLMIALMVVVPVTAQTGKINIKGFVSDIGDGTLIVESNKGETFTVMLPEGFDVDTIAKEDPVLIKGLLNEDGSVNAITIKLVGKAVREVDNENDDTDIDDQDQPEGSKINAAFCADGKQEKPHPLAEKMAERYDVTEDWVMERFCEGYSIGAIMLALKTSQLDGVDLEAGTILSQRSGGNSWGKIWHELKLIGNLKEGQSPPGFLKKPDHAGPKVKD
jgi:hypothetical protein